MKEYGKFGISKIFILLIFLTVVGIISSFNVYAADGKDYLTNISIRISNAADPESVECIDQENHIYMITPTARSINKVEGILQEQNLTVEFVSNNADSKVTNLEYTNNEDGTRNFVMSTRMGSYKGPYLFYLNIKKEDVVLDTYTIIINLSTVGNVKQHSIGTDIALVDGDKVIQQLLTAEEYVSGSEKVAVQTINLEKGHSSVAVRIKKDCPIPQMYLSVRDDPNYFCRKWCLADENYISVNGGEQIRFDSASNDLNKTSPALNLRKGLNVVEILQNTIGNPQQGGGFRTSASWCSKIVLINCEEEVKPSTSSNTDLDLLTAISWVNDRGVDKYVQYTTELDNEKNTYAIYLPDYMKYNLIAVGISTKDPSTKWEVTPNSGTAGRYVAVDITERKPITVTVTASDGTKVEKTIEIKKAPESADASLYGLDIRGASLASGEKIDKNTGLYTVCLPENTTQITLKPNCADFAKEVTVDGKALNEDGTITVNIDNISRIHIVAEDGYTEKTYRLLYQKADGSYPYFGISEETKKEAADMLTKWNASANSSKEFTPDYWFVYMAKATGIDLDGTYVYDVTNHTYNQATDWAAAILELCIAGENPYDFNGVNYVEGLLGYDKDAYFGPYAANIWTYLAFRAAGYDYEKMDKLVAEIKEQAFRKTEGMADSIDMGAWAAAAIADKLTVEEKVAWAENIYENCQKKDGEEAGIFMDNYYLIPNSNTHGCILTALNMLNVDPEMFAISEDKSPLKTVKNMYLTEEGWFKYNLTNTYSTNFNKDMVIGLGDLVSGTNVWVSMYLDNQKLNDLITASEKLLGKGTDKQNAALQKAYDAAVAVKDKTSGFATEYFNLQTAAKAIGGADIAPSCRMCSKETGKTIDKLISDIDKIGTVTLDKEDDIKVLKKTYDELPTDVSKIYVTNIDVLTAAIDKVEQLYLDSIDEKIANLGDVDDLTIENQAAVKEVKELYDALSDSQKKSLENGKTVQKAVNKMAALEVEALIEVIPEEVTLKNEKEIQAARKAYNELTTAQKRLVLSETYVKLTDAEKALKALKKPVVTIKLNKTSLTLKQNQKVTLKATVSSKEDVFWTSSNPKVASVDNSGVVTSYKDGTTVIKAFTKNGDKATCTVKVNAKLQLKANANKLTWKKIADAKGYKVYQYNSTSKKYKKIATLSASKTSYTVNKLNAGTNYTFKVTSYKVENGKDVTKKSEVVKTATKPAKVTINKVAKKSAKSIKITWKKTKATGYEVWMKSSKNGAYKLVKTITKSSTTSYTKSNLAKNKTYTFKIRAYKNVGDQTLYGAYSTAKSLKLK